MNTKAIRERILAAGFNYPGNWDEMGSSEKDLWEDNIIDFLNKDEYSASLEGDDAHHNGQSLEDNPYPAGSRQAEAWISGFENPSERA